MNKKAVFLCMLVALLMTGGYRFFVYSGELAPEEVPDGAYEKIGIITSISPNCGETIVLVEGKAQTSDETVLCDGGGFLRVDELLIQYETGLTPNYFAYDIDGISVGDKVQAIYVKDDNDRAVLNCDGCGVNK